MKNLYVFTTLVCFASSSYSMEKNIQHALLKMKHVDKKSINNLTYSIDQITIDINNPPPQDRFEIDTRSEKHICLWSCLDDIKEIKAAVQELHEAVKNNKIEIVRSYLKEAPSLTLFADEAGITVFEKAQENEHKETLNILLQPQQVSSCPNNYSIYYEAIQFV